MKYLVLVLMCFLLTSCANGYVKFYHPFVDPHTLTDVEMLKSGETPKVFASDDLKRDQHSLASKGYITIGASSFNGKYVGEQDAIDQATSLGALLVLIKSKYTGTNTSTIPLFIPDNQTTYTSGTVYGSRGGSASYSGSSTTYGTTVVPITTSQRRYDQAALYFVKSTKKQKFGLMVKDMTQEQRVKLERNTGVYIDNVREDTPVFYANVLPGDFLIEINGTSINNSKHAIDIMKDCSAPKANLKIIRNGVEKQIEVQLNK